MKSILSFISILFVTLSLFAQNTEIVYLSGKGSDDAVQWDFMVNMGMNSGEWKKIAVPSNWELQGFGTYEYGHKENKVNETGFYKYKFNASKTWKGKSVRIVFEASMTDTEVKINGKLAGPVHQGGFYRFEYEISNLIKYGTSNMLEVRVDKVSKNQSVNEAERAADYWSFGGIFRPVYLRILPPENIERIAINALADGRFNAEVITGSLTKSTGIKGAIYDPAGKKILDLETQVKAGKANYTFETSVDNPAAWSPEYPNLYKVVIDLMEGNRIAHSVTEKFGFRTIELRKRDGVYLNGVKIMFKGVCRHSAWPSTGRTTNLKLSIDDVNLMKDMNMNAVRMSHYPPDPHFLDVCDSLGLMVIDELAGWQFPPYDTLIGTKLVKELVVRDVNHPCIVLWANGNEGGHNHALDHLFGEWDLQKRHVIHPIEVFDGTDTQHYVDYNYGPGTHFNGREVFFPTEFLHGLYDGGNGAGLNEYWNLMLRNPLSAGGFLWVFADEGVVRTDMKNMIDTQGNLAPDGILGPYREKEGSFYSIKEIWSPVYIPMENLPENFPGVLPVENRYYFTDISKCRFEVTLKKISSSLKNEKAEQKSYALKSPSIDPGGKGMLHLELPGDWKKYSVIELKAADLYGREIMMWAWPTGSPANFSENIPSVNSGTVEEVNNDSHIILSSRNVRAYFNKTTGLLDSVFVDGKDTGFGKGPVLENAKDLKFNGFTTTVEGGKIKLTGTSVGGFNKLNWIMHPGGSLELDYDYTIRGKLPYAGISFSLPESSVSGVTLLADGPYRVWKNRLKGPQFGLWDKNYNNTITGESWEYPEFKGFYSRFYGARFKTSKGDFKVLTSSEDMFLRLYTPPKPAGANNNNTSPEFPSGDISFLHAISPIGMKFATSAQLGPEGEMNNFELRKMAKKGTLFFYFQE